MTVKLSGKPWEDFFVQVLAYQQSPYRILKVHNAAKTLVISTDWGRGRQLVSSLLKSGFF